MGLNVNWALVKVFLVEGFDVSKRENDVKKCYQDAKIIVLLERNVFL